MAIRDTTNNQLTYSFTVPDTAIGPMPILAFGENSTGEWTGFDSAIVFIEPIVPLDSVVPYPKNLFIPTGSTMGFQLYGHFADGKVLPLHPSSKFSGY